MATQTKPFQLSEASQQNIVRFAKAAITNSNLNNFISERQNRFQRIDRYYHRENFKTPEVLAAERAAKAGDKTKLREIIIGLVKQHVDSAVGYLQETYLSGYPIFPVVSEPGQADQAAIQLETIIADHCYEAGWEAEFLLAFQDSMRYNEAFLEVEWCYRKVAAIGASDEVQKSNGNKATETEWAGNVITRWDPYNTFYDPRVAFHKLALEGEYIGHKEIWTKIKLKSFILDKQADKLPVMNPVKSLQCEPSGDTGRYFAPVVILNDEEQRGSVTNWAEYGGFVTGAKEVLTGAEGSRYSNQYEVTTLYARLIPSEYGISVNAKNTPQIWKFIVVNDQYVIWAEQLTNAHGYLPVVTCQPVDPGLGTQAKSFADGVTSYQDTASALWNLGLAANRRMVVDRMIYDPSKIDVMQMNNPNAAAKIPLRASAYGTNPAQAVYAVPFNVGQANSLFSEAQGVVGFADELNGQNRASRGQFQKGNKSRYEYSDVMSNSNANNRAYALQWEIQSFSIIKKILLLNVLQYADQQTLFNRDLQADVTINPVEIRKAAVKFKVADGVRPADKLLNGDDWSGALNVLSTNQQIGAEYNVGGIFESLMAQKGVNLRPFKIPDSKRMYDQALSAWQQQAQLAAEKGMEFKVPMPDPKAYGVNPQQPNAQPQQQGTQQ